MSIFLAFVISLTACSINEPQLPKWDTNWQLSLTGGRVTLSDLLKNSDLKDSLNTAYFSVQDSTERQAIQQKDLSFKADDHHFSNKIGIFSVKKPQPKTAGGETFAEIFAAYNPQVGTVFPKLDPFTLTPDPRVVTFDEFQSLDIYSGTFTVKFHNDLILGIASGMKVVLNDLNRINESDSGLIDTIYFNGPIPQGATLESEPVNLAGKTISNNLQLRYFIPIAGTDSAQTLTQDDLNSSFYTEVSMSDIKVNSASAKVPEQSFTYDNNAPVVVGELAIRRASINSGMIHFDVNNHMALSGRFTLTFPDFRSAGDAPLSTAFQVDANSQKDVAVNLADYILQNGSNPGEFLDTLRYQVQAVTDSSNGVVRVSADDSLSIDVRMDSLFFGDVSGYLSPKQVEIPAVNQSGLFDFNGLSGKFTLPDMVLTMDFHSQIDMPVNLDIDVIGYHRDAVSGHITDSIDVKINKTVQSGNNPNPTSLVLDRQSSQPSIVDLMSIMPTDIKVKGQATISGDGDIKVGDAFWVTYKIESPLTVKVDEALTYETTRHFMGEQDIDAEQRDKITQNFSEVTATVKTANHFPIGAQVLLFVSRDSSNLYSDVITDSTRKAVFMINVAPGEQNADGVVTAAASDENVLKLTRKQIHIFEQVPIYYGAKVILPATTAPARFKNDDALHYEPALQFKVKVDPNAL